MYALRSVSKARLCFIIVFSHHLHLDSTTTSSSYELLKFNFIFAFAESKKWREGINPELVCWTPLCCHLQLCGGSLSTGGGQEASRFPRKKSPVSSVLLLLAASWIGKKTSNNSPLNPKATFDSDKSLAWSWSTTWQNLLEVGGKLLQASLLTSMLDFEGEIVEKNKEWEVKGLSNRVKNNNLGIISWHRSVCTAAQLVPHQSVLLVVIIVN